MVFSTIQRETGVEEQKCFTILRIAERTQHNYNKIIY